MELSIRPSATAPISYTGDNEKIGQRVKDRSTELTMGGGAGVAAFGTLNQSSKIGNNLIKAVKTSKAIKAEKQAQLLKLLTKSGKLAKFATNPIVVKVAGGLAGLSAATTLVGSVAKIADTYGYLSAQNPQA
ncbi:hypothetical protein J6O48_03705 [bacterium]|nr:hypothetical protein [bacterium]